MRVSLPSSGSGLPMSRYLPRVPVKPSAPKIYVENINIDMPHDVTVTVTTYSYLLYRLDANPEPTVHIFCS